MFSRLSTSLPCFLAVSMGFAHASPASDEAMGYQTLYIKAMICKEEYTIGRLKAESGETTPQQAYKDFLQCQSSVSKEAKSVYKRVLNKTKSADAKKAVKDYQVSFMSFLDGMDPKPGETKHMYAQRISALEGGLSSAKQRLDLEIE